MRTISINEFIRDFMDVSKKLTNAEIRMLYLLITEPGVRSITQQDFAEKIETDRRTINIGLKNLRKFNFLTGINFKDISINVEEVMDQSTKFTEIFADITIKELVENIRFIIGSFIDYYPDKKPNEIIVNEDFYSFVLGNTILHRKLRYNKEIITKTIKERFPECNFYFDRKKDSYSSENHYRIIIEFNNQIAISRKSRREKLYLHLLKEHLEEKYSISEHQLLSVIKQDFQNIQIINDVVIIPKSWKS